MQSTAGDANNYPSGYHTNTGYMAFELSHISYHMAPEHAMLLQGTPLQGTPLLHRMLLQRIPHLLQGMQYLLQGMQTITPADTTLIQGIWPLNYLTYHTIWLQNMLCCSRVLQLLQGTPLLHRMLLYCSGYHIYCRGCNAIYCRGCKQLPQRIPH